VSNDVDLVNQHIREMEAKGYRSWNDEPGYTIEAFNELLKPHGLFVEVEDESKSRVLWFRIVVRKP
jgi:hypothetical protein